MLKVEVRNANTALYKAVVLQVKDEGVKVRYENSQEHTVPFTDVRALCVETLTVESIPELQMGEELETYASLREGEPNAWWKCKLKKKGDNWVAVEVCLPDGSVFHEVASASSVRKPNRSPPLTKESFFVVEHECTDQRILDIAKEEAIHNEFCDKVGSCLVVPDNNRLVAICLDPSVLKRASLLFDTHVRFLRMRSELVADIERANYKLEQTKLCGSSGITEKFTIKQYFVGLAIGSRGANITAARELPGITAIELHPTTADPTMYEVLISGTDNDAVKKARGMLEFVEESVLVPEDLISRVIGRNGRMLQDIVDKTQVLKIRIEDQPENKPDGNEGMVPLWCIGSREAFDLAKLMIDYQISTLKDLENVKDERDKLNNQLQNQGVPAVNRLGPPFRGNFGNSRGYPRVGPGRRGIPVRGQPFRGSRGGFRGVPRGAGGPGRRGGGPGMRGSRFRFVDRRVPSWFPEDPEFAGDRDRERDRGERRGRGGGPRGGGPARTRISGDARALIGGENDRTDVGADGDKRNNSAMGGAPNGPLNSEFPSNGTNADQHAPNGTMMASGSGGAPVNEQFEGGPGPGPGQGPRRPKNNSAANPEHKSANHGARPQRQRKSSGEAGKKRTHGDEEDTIMNGNGGHENYSGGRSKMPNGVAGNEKPMNGIPAA